MSKRHTLGVSKWLPSTKDKITFKITLRPSTPNISKHLCICVFIYMLLLKTNKQQHFASIFPARVQVGPMGVGDMGHWETRTLIGFPLLSSSLQPTVPYSGG